MASIPIIPGSNNSEVLILRTLSKAFSLAGMRIGYGIADSGFISELKKLQAPFYMNILSARMAEIIA